MDLPYDTWYRILFASQNTVDRVNVQFHEDLSIPDDHFVFEIQTPENAPVRKCRLMGADGRTLSLCSNGDYCTDAQSMHADPEVNALATGDADTESGMISVSSPTMEEPWDWIPSIGPDTLRVTLFFSLIPEGNPVHPCDPEQPEIAAPDPDAERRTFGAFPMDIIVPGNWNGHGGTGKNKGRKIVVIWDKDQ